MSDKTESLLRDAGRVRELSVGWLCALISGTLASLLGWLIYLVAWRNPHLYDVHDLQKGSPLAILGSLLAAAVGFGVIAVRLIMHSRVELMSPTALRLWGTFFALGGVAVLVDAMLTKKWAYALQLWTVTTGAASMAVAAFALASRREHAKASHTQASQQVEAPNERR